MRVRTNHFNITFEGRVEDPEDCGGKCAYGRITINDWSQRFISPIGYWDEDQYYQQWRDAASDLVAGASKVGFIIRLSGPPEKVNIFGYWAAYRDGDAVQMTEMLHVVEAHGTFQVDGTCAFVREPPFDDPAVSRWKTRIDAFRNYLSTR